MSFMVSESGTYTTFVENNNDFPIRVFEVAIY